jgi:hypothetical protein
VSPVEMEEAEENKNKKIEKGRKKERKIRGPP